AMTSFGTPIAGESVSVSQEFSGPGNSSTFGFNGAKTGPDGSFTIRDMGPGEFKLGIRYAGDGEHAAEAAAMVVTLAGTDLDGVSLMTGGGGTLTGRVV